MLTNLIDHPAVNVNPHKNTANLQREPSTPFFSRDFEIQELEDEETYSSHSNSLSHNNLNSFVVDWELPKMGKAV